MKRSLIKVSVFFGMVTMLALALDSFLDTQMKQLKYEDASVWNEISRGGIDADIIIIGSSRAATHIDPKLITDSTGKTCYNLGMMGHNFFLEYARYNFYLKYNKAPKLIILSLDYESLQRRPDLFNHTQFIAYLNDAIIADATQQYVGFSKYDYQLPLLKYVGEQTLIFSLVKNYFYPQTNLPDRINGFYARDFQWNADVNKTLDTLKPYTVSPDRLSLDFFDAFLNRCKQQNIEVIFVHTPNHPLGQQKVLNRVQIIDLYQNYAQRFKIPFLDYAQDTMCMNKAYFMNSTHLNKYGADVFTRKFISDLEKLDLF
jgi:hypothetical protein